MSGFVTIPGGWFQMGSTEGQADEQPPHRVWVDTFEMAVHPVTRVEYEAFLKTTGHPLPREWDNPVFGRPELPVVGVSWNDAVVYCLWRSSCGNVEHPPVRLPTEAEWEHTARGTGAERRYPEGDQIPDWIPNLGKGPLQGPWDVDLAPPNDYGVKGIGSNIHEWCADWHSREYYSMSPRHNPRGPRHGVRRASRGGSWRHAVTISRSAARSKLSPSYRYTDYGFRLARSHTDEP